MSSTRSDAAQMSAAEGCTGIRTTSAHLMALTLISWRRAAPSIVEAPADWLGPMALATAAATSSAPSCNETGYARQVLSLFGEIDEGEAVCGCACNTPSNMTCGSSVEIYRAPTTPACVVQIGASPAYTVSTGACTGTLATGRYTPRAPTLSGGACTPEPTVDIEAAAFARRMVACETTDSDPAGCDTAELCVPELVSPLETFCIYRVGTHSCPSGPYSELTVYYDDLADDRSCTTCTCGALTGSCEGEVVFSESTRCPPLTVDVIERVSYGDCVVIDSSHTNPKASATSITPQGACPPSGGVLEGSADGEGAVSVCCMP
jgi:hypothetical protein